MGYFRENVEKAAGYVPGFQPGEADVVKLNTNENPYPPSPRVLEAIRKVTPEQLRRYPNPMGDLFRKAAGKINGLTEGHIMCTNGGDELLSLAIRAFCDASRPVAYPVPTYSLYPVLARLENVPAIEIPFDTGFRLPAELEKTGAALTIVCNPNAPSGSMVPLNQIAQLAGMLKGVLLVDEAYVDFAEYNCVELVKEFNNVVLLRSMSKGYSLAGMRFGYAISRPEIIGGLMKVKDSYNVDAVAIAVATAAVEDQAYFKQNVEKIKRERTRLTSELRKMGFEVPESQSNFLLAKCNSCEAAEIYKKLVECRVYVRYFVYPGLVDKLRITVGTAEQNDKLIYALREILSK